jgi:hypothetical protein
MTKRESLEKTEHCAQLLVDRRRPIVVDDELRFSITQGCLRDRGVCVGSKDALIESRHECRKELALADAPRRRTSHHLMGELGEWLPKEVFAVEQRSYNAWRVSHHKAHDGEYRSFTQAMPVMDFLQSHASLSALSPACNL